MPRVAEYPLFGSICKFFVVWSLLFCKLGRAYRCLELLAETLLPSNGLGRLTWSTSYGRLTWSTSYGRLTWSTSYGRTVAQVQYRPTTQTRMRVRYEFYVIHYSYVGSILNSPDNRILSVTAALTELINCSRRR